MSPAGARYAVFLRGMNLGGRRITNEDLCAAVAGLGFGAQAYQAAGNLIVEAKRRQRADAVRAALEKGLAAALGYEVPAFVRDEGELRAIVAREPFAREAVARSGGKPQVALLQETPTSAARSAVLALATADDALVLVEREIHWLPGRGAGRSELDWKRIAKLVGPATVRTAGTLERLLARYF